MPHAALQCGDAPYPRQGAARLQRRLADLPGAVRRARAADVPLWRQLRGLKPLAKHHRQSRTTRGGGVAAQDEAARLTSALVVSEMVTWCLATSTRS